MAREHSFRGIARLILVLGLAPLPSRATAVTFTSITDPANPVVQDLAESGGGSWIDLDGDGDLDLFVANGNLSNQNNSLYLNDGAWGFIKIVTGNPVTDGGSSIGSTWGDYDADGHLDLFVTNRNNFGNFLYRGLGDSLFQKITTGGPATDIANSNSSSWVDADNDGDLDLYVVNFGGLDFMYVNGGAPSYAFTRADTVAMAPGAENSINGVWGDVNADGLPDLFVGNAGTQNDYVYLNRGGLWFTRTTLLDGRSTLGGSWSDFDNDGDLDLFAANFSNQASLLYANAGAPGYALAPIGAAPFSTDPGNAVGTSWGDFDNDGDVDLFVARDGQNNVLYENAGPPGYGFTKVVSGPEVSDGGNSFGTVWADVDNDGDLDLFVANRLNQKNFLYRNDGPTGHWAEFDLTGSASNRTAIGAKLRVQAMIGGSPRWQLREVQGQTGYNSQILRQHVGLGDATAIDSLVVEWPSGARDVSVSLPVDRRYELNEGTTLGVPAPGASRLRLALASANPSRGDTRLAIELAEAGRARLAIYDAAGREIARPVDGVMSAGRRVVQFTPRTGLPEGVYFARLAAAGEVRALRFVYLR